MMAVGYLGMNVLRIRIRQNGNTVGVDYSPIGCQRANMNFKMATEAPCKWPNITEKMEEVQMKLLQMTM